MSRHDLVSAQNHAEDVVAVSSLTANVSRTHHETFSFNKCYSNNLWSYFQQCSWEIGSEWAERVEEVEVGWYTQSRDDDWSIQLKCQQSFSELKLVSENFLFFQEPTEKQQCVWAWLWISLSLGLGQLCLKLPVLCYANNSWKCNVMDLTFDPRPSQVLQIDFMAACSCNASIQQAKIN